MLFSLLSILAIAAAASTSALSERATGSQVCQTIAGNTTGKVYYPLDLSANFNSDIEHYMTSSSQTPMCVVEVANTADISTVLQIVGSTRTPFAVKSGGHASNPGWSSTTGVFISLVNLKQVVLSADKKSVTIGMGSLWTEVYSALNGTDVNVVGGRVAGPGTGGFSLGGGYSWLTNQYGLTCDVILSYELVLPSGSIQTISATSNPDLFFALKGGLNRFGIVSSIVYKTVPQTPLVYGGIQIYGDDVVPALINATQKFHTENTDPKAQIILTINGGLAPEAILLMFYDGPGRPAAFAPYDAIETKPLIDGLKVQTYASFSTSVPSLLSAGSRGAFATVSTTRLTEGFMNAVHNESSFYSKLSIVQTGTFLSYDVEPFMKYGQYATDSAYPHDLSPLPLNLYFSWVSSTQDAFWRGAIQQSANHLTDVAKAEGIWYDGVYPNYALDTTSGAAMYGAKNAARLRNIQSQYDPQGVMLLAGGPTF